MDPCETALSGADCGDGCGGSGGGKPDSAMAGGKDISKISEALAHAEEILKA